MVEGWTSQPLAGFTAQHATVTFSVVDDVAAMHVELDQLPAGWAPSASFPSLERSVSDEFDYASPVLTLDSTNPPRLPDGYPAGYGRLPYSSATTAAMAYGMGLRATVTPRAAGGPLEWLLSGTSWDVAGPIALPESQLSMALSSAPQPALEIAGFAIPFSLHVASVAVEPVGGGPPVVSSLLQLDAEVSRDLGGGTVLHLPFVLRVPSAAEPTVTIASDLPPGTGITPAQIATLIGARIDGQVPSDFPALDGIGLQRVEFSLVPSAPQPLTSISATIGWVTSQPYPVFDGLVTFDGMAVTFTYLPGGYGRDDGSVAHVMTDVTGAATVAGGTLDAVIALPDRTFSSTLETGTVIDIKELVRHAVGDSITMPSVRCTALTVFGSVEQATYRFQATISDDDPWAFQLGTTPFALSQLDMDIDKGPNGFGGEITCRVGIADADLFGRAAYDPATQGWAFQVGTIQPVAVDLAALAADISRLFGHELQPTAPPLTLDALNLSFDTATHAFGFQCSASLTMAGTPVQFGIEVANDLEFVFRGLLWVGESYFEVDFEHGDQRETLTAVWRATEDQAYLEFGDVLQALGLPPPEIPPSLDLRLVSAQLTYDFDSGELLVMAESKTYGEAALVVGKNANGARGFIFGVVVGVDIELDLTDIDVVGKLVPQGDDRLSVTDLRVVAASAAVPSYTPTPELARILGDQVHSGLALSIGLRLGTGVTRSLALLLGGSGERASPAVAEVAGPGQAPRIAWVDVQRAFGPVRFGRVGATIAAGGDLALLLDAAVSLAGLDVALDGLQTTVPISPPHTPSFALSGLHVRYQGGGLVIGGGLTRPPGRAEYDGELTITAGEFGATALGSYVTVDGEPSLFCFVFVEEPLGGPPFFFVTGLAGGFGYNRTLRLPTIDQVATYPLVRGAMGQLDAATTQGLLEQDVEPAMNADWLAAGVRFTSFEVVRSYALLTLSFGAHTEIALMGRSTLTVPVSTPAKPEPPVAQADLALLADLDPTRGQLAVDAQLTPSSYVFSSAAQLTGGFAFYTWFGSSDGQAGPPPGDFALTLGGYNPYFSPPSHYPRVPRLGLNWRVSGELTVKGSLYFALTPAVVMAGAQLQATWQSGDVTAWFDAAADFLIRFKPFQYAVHVNVSIGVAVKLAPHLTNKAITVHVGVGLDLWGPPFGGRARVDLSVASFTISFGTSTRPEPPPVLWGDFRRSFLPPANAGERTQAPALHAGPEPTVTGSLITLGAPAGLLGTLTNGGRTVWLVDPATLRIAVGTQVPSKTASVTAQAEQVPTGSWSTAFGIGPMGVAPGQLAVALDIRIEREGTADSWTAAAVTGNAPAGLWLHASAELRSDALVGDVLTGMALTPTAPEPDTTLPVPVDELLTDDPPVCRFSWSTATIPTSDPFDQGQAIPELRGTLADPEVASKREELLAALGTHGLDVASTVDVGHFAAEAADLLVSPPALRLLGEAPSTPGGGSA